MTTLILKTTFPRVRVQKWRSLIRLTTLISKITLKMISSLTKLTAPGIKITSKKIIIDYADIQLNVKNNFIVDYTQYTL